MTTAIKRSLQGHEEIIESGMKSFLDVGRSLISIRDEKLYGDKYDTFEAYCKQRWGFAKRRAYQFIEATEVVEDLCTIVHTKTNNSSGNKQIPLPENEAQARAVADASHNPKERERVWKAAVETAPKDDDGKPRITAAVVKKAAAAVLKPREPGEDEIEPQHQPKEPESKDESTPFDEPLAGIDFVLKVAVPKVQEFAIAVEHALGSGKAGFSADRISRMVAPIHEAFTGVRGVIANAQQRHRRGK